MAPIVLPTAHRPLDGAEADREGRQDLKDSNVVFTALHASRKALLNECFRLFSTRAKGGQGAKDGGGKKGKAKAQDGALGGVNTAGLKKKEDVAECSTWDNFRLSLLGVTDVQIGPHIFYDLAFYEACEEEERPQVPAHVPGHTAASFISGQPVSLNGLDAANPQMLGQLKTTQTPKPQGMVRGPYKPRLRDTLTPLSASEEEAVRERKKERARLRAREKAALRKRESDAASVRAGSGSILGASSSRPTTTSSSSSSSQRPQTPVAGTSQIRDQDSYVVSRVAGLPNDRPLPSNLAQNTATLKGMRQTPPHTTPIPPRKSGPASLAVPPHLIASLAAAAKSDPRISNLLTRVAEKRATKDELHMLNNFIKDSQNRAPASGLSLRSPSSTRDGALAIPEGSSRQAAPASSLQRSSLEAVRPTAADSESAFRLRGGAVDSEALEDSDTELYANGVQNDEQLIPGEGGSPRGTKDAITQVTAVKDSSSHRRSHDNDEVTGEIPGLKLSYQPPSPMVEDSALHTPARLSKSPSSTGSETVILDDLAQDATSLAIVPLQEPERPAKSRKRAIVFEFSEYVGDRWILPQESIFQPLSQDCTCDHRDVKAAFANIYTMVANPVSEADANKYGETFIDRHKANGLNEHQPRAEVQPAEKADRQKLLDSGSEEDHRIWSPLLISLLRPLNERCVQAFKAYFLPPAEVRDIFSQKLAKAAAGFRTHLVLRVPGSVSTPTIEPVLEKNLIRAERGQYQRKGVKRSAPVSIDGDRDDSEDQAGGRLKGGSAMTNNQVRDVQRRASPLGSWMTPEPGDSDGGTVLEIPVEVNRRL